MITVEYGMIGGSPCDSCGIATIPTEPVTITVTNKKSELGYKLPIFSLCDICKKKFKEQVNQS